MLSWLAPEKNSKKIKEMVSSCSKLLEKKWCSFVFFCCFALARPRKEFNGVLLKNSKKWCSSVFFCCFALLCFALLCFALLCFALLWRIQRKEKKRYSSEEFKEKKRCFLFLENSMVFFWRIQRKEFKEQNTNLCCLKLKTCLRLKKRVI